MLDAERLHGRVVLPRRRLPGAGGQLLRRRRVQLGSHARASLLLAQP